MYDWFIGENIKQFLNDGVRYAGGGDCIPNNVFTPGTGNPTPPTALCNNYYQFYRDTTTNQLSLIVTGTFPCSGTNIG
jgi:hypothetical protein